MFHISRSNEESVPSNQCHAATPRIECFPCPPGRPCYISLQYIVPHLARNAATFSEKKHANHAVRIRCYTPFIVCIITVNFWYQRKILAAQRYVVHPSRSGFERPVQNLQCPHVFSKTHFVTRDVLRSSLLLRRATRCSVAGLVASCVRIGAIIVFCGCAIHDGSNAWDRACLRNAICMQGRSGHLLLRSRWRS